MSCFNRSHCLPRRHSRVVLNRSHGVLSYGSRVGKHADERRPKHANGSWARHKARVERDARPGDVNARSRVGILERGGAVRSRRLRLAWLGSIKLTQRRSGRRANAHREDQVRFARRWLADDSVHVRRHGVETVRDNEMKRERQRIETIDREHPRGRWREPRREETPGRPCAPHVEPASGYACFLLRDCRRPQPSAHRPLARWRSSRRQRS